MPKALDPEVHATVKQAAAFLDRSRVTVMRRIATGALPSEKVRQRGAREIRAIKWEDLAEARYGSDHPPVMTDQQLVTEAAQTGEAVTAVMRPSGHWQTVGPGYAIGGQGDPPAQVEDAKLRMLEGAALVVASAAARLKEGDVADAERSELATVIRIQGRLVARLANETTQGD